MDNGNAIEGIEKYQTRKGTDKKEPMYDKVMKILGLTAEELKEND